MIPQEEILKRHLCQALGEPELTEEEWEEAKRDEEMKPLIEGALNAMEEWAKEQVNGIIGEV